MFKVLCYLYLYSACSPKGILALITHKTQPTSLAEDLMEEISFQIFPEAEEISFPPQIQREGIPVSWNKN